MQVNKPDVGQRLRMIREERGLSLRALAEQSGLSFNAISLIERGENSPTVSSLHMLATALSIPITDFFEESREQAVVYVRPDARLRSVAKGIAMESLGIGLQNQQIEPFLITVAPESGNLDQPITHLGEEFVYCLTGQIQYSIENRIYLLETGYSLLFDASLPHCFYNPGDVTTQLIMIFASGQGGHLARQLHMEASHAK